MRLVIGIMIVAVCIALEAAAAAPILRHAESIQHEYIVALKERNPAAIEGLARSIAEAYGGEVVAIFDTVLGGLILRAPEGVIERLRNDPRVRFIESNGRTQLFSRAEVSSTTSSQSAFFSGEELWYLDRIDSKCPGDMDSVYQFCETNGTNVVIYMLDTGVWAGHPEFGGRVIQSVDFDGRAEVGAPSDPSLLYRNQGANPCTYDAEGWHGTATASVAAGTNVGVADGAFIISLAVFDCRGAGDVGAMIGALNWIVGRTGTQQLAQYRDPSLYPANVARNMDGSLWPAVINLSGLTFPGDRVSGASWSIEAAVWDMVNNWQIPVITSANNQSGDACNTAPANLGMGGPGAQSILQDGSPGFSPGCVLTVGGTQKPSVHEATTECNLAGQAMVMMDNRWQGSNFVGSNSGPCVSLWAPAFNIYAARHDRYRQVSGSLYGYANGTSFSAPIVSGLAARFIHQQISRGLGRPSPFTVYDFLMSNDADTMYHDYTPAHYQCGTDTFTQPGCCVAVAPGQPCPSGQARQYVPPATSSRGHVYFWELPCRRRAATRPPG